MAIMFNEATAFNQPLSSWDVSKVQGGRGRGRGETHNPNTYIQKVTNMRSMFYQATAFSQVLCWDISGKSTGSMFDGSSGSITTSSVSTPENKALCAQVSAWCHDENTARR